MATIDDAANPVEQVAHDAHRRSRHQWPEDIDGDGDVDSADDAIMDALSGSFPIAITSGSYHADADIDRDGDVDSTDAQAVTDALTTAALAPGQISDPAGPDNPIGYDGYVFNATDGTYTVRFRTYFPELGRWGERDPRSYIDGMSLFLYTYSHPVGFVDPFGAQAETPEEEPCCEDTCNRQVIGILQSAYGFAPGDSQELLGDLNDINTFQRAVAIMELIKGGAGGLRALRRGPGDLIEWVGKQIPNIPRKKGKAKGVQGGVYWDFTEGRAVNGTSIWLIVAYTECNTDGSSQTRIAYYKCHFPRLNAGDQLDLVVPGDESRAWRELPDCIAEAEDCENNTIDEPHDGMDARQNRWDMPTTQPKDLPDLKDIPEIGPAR